jgi:hypothetical protein
LDLLNGNSPNNAKPINFMDVHLPITPTGIKLALYKKSINLYLYLPPPSARPPGILPGLIIGMAKQIYALMNKQPNQVQSLHQLFLHLCHNHSHDPPILRPIFEIAIQKAHTKIPATTDSNDKKRCFLHLTYHPQDPSSTVIQRIFCNTLLKPTGKPTLP